MAISRFNKPINRYGTGSRHFKHYATVASDTNLLTDGPGGTPPFKIIVWGAGDLVVQRVDGTNITFSGLPAGALLDDIEPYQLISSGTTATEISVFW